MRHLTNTALLICLLGLLAACQGPEGPMGPASSPKTASELAADTTGCEVVINITGENIIYEGDNPDTNTVVVYDTIAVDDSGGTILGEQFAFITVVLHATLTDFWTIKSDRISESTVKELLLRRNWINTDNIDVSTAADEVFGFNWMEFNAWADLFTPPLQTKPSYKISDGQIFISDPDRVIPISSYLGILLGS